MRFPAKTSRYINVVRSASVPTARDRPALTKLVLTASSCRVINGGSADFDELTNECVRNGKRESCFAIFSFAGRFLGRWRRLSRGVRKDLLLRLPADKVVHDSN